MEIEEILQNELTKLKAENEELRNTVSNYEKNYIPSHSYFSEVKGRERMRKLYAEKLNENTQLKEKLKEVEQENYQLRISKGGLTLTKEQAIKYLNVVK